MTRLPSRKIGTAAILAAGLTLPTGALADGTTAVSEVVITATRLPAPLDLTPGAYVITDKDIQLRQATFAADILSTAPGLTVANSGAFGGVTSVRQRGATSDKSLVLIDGVPLNDASQPQGGFDFSAVDLADIKRVEVLNGPQGSIWGSDAIGGVIAFTTREPDGVRLNLMGGSFGTSQVSGSIGRATDRWAFGVSASSFDTNGVSVADTHFGAAEPDGTRQLTAGLRGRVNVTEALQLDGQVRINQSTADIDGFKPPFYDRLTDTNDISTSRNLDAYLHARIDGPWSLHTDLSADRYVISRGDSGESGDFGYAASRNVYRWTTARGSVADGVSVLFGAERQEAHASLSDGSTHDLGTTSVFAVGQWRPIDRLSASASLRLDDPDVYRGQTTARGGLGYRLGGGFSLAASYGQGFKTPTISETACDFCYVTPITNLQPEHADGADLGLVWRSPDNQVSARATVFQLNVRDEIAYVGGHYINIARTRSRGVEAEVEAALGAGFRIQAAYTHDDAVNLATGLRELRVPADSFSGALLWTHDRFDAVLSLRSESQQADTALDGFDPIQRPGFTVASLAGNYALNNHLTLTGRVENLANTFYEQSYGYGEPGRSVFVGVRLRN